MRFARVSVSMVVVLLLVACDSADERASDYLSKGDRLLQEGLPVKARLEYQNALQIDEGLADAWYGMARISLLDSDWLDAYSMLTKISELEPNHVPAQSDLARIYLAAGEKEKARDIAVKLLGSSPDDPQLMSLNATVLYSMGAKEQALKLARDALSVDPDDVAAVVVLATNYIKVGDAQQALTLLNSQSEERSDEVVLRLLQVEALKQVGNSDEVEKVYRDLIELYPHASSFQAMLTQHFLGSGQGMKAEEMHRNRLAQHPDSMETFAALLDFLDRSQGQDSVILELSKAIRRQPQNYEYQFMLARFLQDTGDNSKASEILVGVYESAKLPQDRNRAAVSLAANDWQSGDYDKAQEWAELVLAEDPIDERALIIRASMFLSERETEQAVSTLRTLLRAFPESTEAIFLLARAHELSGDMRLADTTYNRAWISSDSNRDVGLIYTQFLVEQGELGRAREILTYQLRNDPDHIDSLAAMAKLDLVLGDIDVAQGWATRIEGLDENSVVPHQIMGSVYAAQDQQDWSIDSFELAYRSSPGNYETMELLVNAYLLSGQFDQAHQFLDDVLSTDSGSQVGRVLRARVFSSEERYKEAVDVLVNLLEIAPDLESAYIMLSATYMNIGDYQSAISTINSGLLRAPRSFDLLFSRALALQEKGDVESAIKDYEALVFMRPDIDVVANNYASLLLDHREDDISIQRAFEMARRFHSSEIPYYRDTLGWSYYRLGQATRALSLIEKAAEALPDVPVFQYHLGMIYLALNDDDRARQHLLAAASLTHGNNASYKVELDQALASIQ